ncbi:hypothetical protein BSK47_19235 [Paenibacillus odorifer]|uniref:DUF2198 domain-containing protein n=1 Tax=Paenibacillus odorifer TaxID=189426 RepID=A0AB36JEI2_9BACL|nr:hypothetical protein BSK47_19235 [Paenibacillus odorifer]
MVIRMVLIIILILAVLYSRSLKNIISFLFLGFVALFLWEFAWWGKIIDILFISSMLLVLILGFIRGFKVNENKPDKH